MTAPQKRAQFGGTAGLTDDFDPRSGAGGVDRAGLQQAGEHAAGLGGLDGLEGELELAFAALGLPGPRFQGRDPRLGKLVDGQPEGVVERWIHRLLEHAEGDLCGPGIGNPSEGADGFEADGGRRVLREFFEGWQAGILREQGAGGQQGNREGCVRGTTWHAGTLGGEPQVGRLKIQDPGFTETGLHAMAFPCGVGANTVPLQ